MATYINGQSGTAAFGAYTFGVTSWTLDIDSEALNTTNVSSSGWKENIAAPKGASGSCTGFWDTNSMPTATVLPGASATLTLTIGSSTKSFSFTARVTKIKTENPAEAVVAFSFDFVSTGAVTYPA